MNVEILNKNEQFKTESKTEKNNNQIKILIK
jgi:hypothetical protein